MRTTPVAPGVIWFFQFAGHAVVESQGVEIDKWQATIWEGGKDGVFEKALKMRRSRFSFAGQ